MDSTAALSVIFLSEDGQYAAQLSGRDLIIHSNPAAPESREVQAIRVKENLQASTRILKFSRTKFVEQTASRRSEDDDASERRMLCASDARISVWQLNPLQLYADIESIEPGALNIEFGGDGNEVIVFHAWNTKATIYAMDTGSSQVIKAPKFSHSNGFGYRPRTRQFAILLKPETSDLLTIHEFRSYELINRAILPTVDAQGLKWSPDGKWVAVWDTASSGTKVLIYTADGQPFRTYTGPPEHENAFDLGVKSIEWGPATGRTAGSEFLAVGKVDGNIDVLSCKTFSCSISLSHTYLIDQNSPNIWRECYATADGNLEYVEISTSSAFSAIGEPSGPPRGVSVMAFSSNGSFLATVDQLRPNIVWIWSLEATPKLETAFVHENPVRQVVWHPCKTELLITTVNSAVPAVRHWSSQSKPVIVRVPVPRNETGRYDVRWLASRASDLSIFWVGTSEDYVLGCLSQQEDGVSQFNTLQSVSSRIKAHPWG